MVFPVPNDMTACKWWPDLSVPRPWGKEELPDLRDRENANNCWRTETKEVNGVVKSF